MLEMSDWHLKDDGPIGDSFFRAVSLTDEQDAEEALELASDVTTLVVLVVKFSNFLPSEAKPTVLPFDDVGDKFPKYELGDGGIKFPAWFSNQSMDLK